MAIVGTHIVANNDTTGGTSQVVSSVVLPTNELVLLWVGTTKVGGGDEPSGVTSSSFTWVNIGTAISNNRRITLFRTMAGSGATENVTITTALAQTGFLWTFSRYAGVDITGSNGENAVVAGNIKTATGNDDSPTVTMNAFGSASNGVAAGLIEDTKSAFTPGTGFTELGGDNFMSSPNTGLGSEWRADNDTSVDGTFAGTVNWAILALELAAPSSGLSIPIAMNYYAQQ